MGGFVTQRRFSREFAFKFLYQRQANGSVKTTEQDLSLFIKDIPEDERPSDEEFTRELVLGVCREMENIDSLISMCSDNWKIARMSPVDINIMRVAVYEMLYMGDIDRGVSINEAVEMAGKYGGEKSGSFINGVLDKIKSERGNE